MIACGIQITRLRDSDEDKWQALWRAGVSEFFATMIFVFLGTGSVVASKAALGSDAIQIPSLTLIALAHGFAIMILVYAVGEVSGGHINPAVTWACLITDRISVLRAIVYWICQIIGGIVGSGLLKGLLPPELQFSLGCHSINPKLAPGAGFAMEIIFTFIFILIVFATAISPFVGKVAPLGGGKGDYGPGKLTPFAVGMTILVLHTVGVPFTGASMNPARSYGPAVVRGDHCWQNHWVYWLGPLFGSTLAAIVAQVIFLSSPTALKKMLIYTRGLNPLEMAQEEREEEELVAPLELHKSEKVQQEQEVHDEPAPHPQTVVDPEDI